MALTLYRRHRRECKAGHKEQSFSTEFEERKRGWTRCECPIVISGTLQKKFKRHSTNLWEWDAARPIATQFEASGSWFTPAPSSAPVQSPADPKPRITIADATASFLESCENRGITIATLRKYRTFIKQFTTFTTSRGYVMFDQLTIADMDRFYASWKDGKRAKGKKLDRLKSFIKFCVKRKWIAENIAEDLKAPEGSSIPAAKSPFTDEELTRIFAACDSLGAPIAPGPGHRPWSGEDAKDFLLLSVYTGLRISDVATFDADKRLNGNNVLLRMHKTGKELNTWIPSWLVERIQERRKLVGPMIFKTGLGNPGQGERDSGMIPNGVPG